MVEQRAIELVDDFMGPTSEPPYNDEFSGSIISSLVKAGEAMDSLLLKMGEYGDIPPEFDVVRSDWMIMVGIAIGVDKGVPSWNDAKDEHERYKAWKESFLQQEA